ncbi:hypothetical protein PMAYCL1PPCAC_25162, partial [Pristionchus mayeri]
SAPNASPPTPASLDRVFQRSCSYPLVVLVPQPSRRRHQPWLPSSCRLQTHLRPLRPSSDSWGRGF